MPDLEMRELPEVITLRAQGRRLGLRWSCGNELEIDAGLLRAKCRCSVCSHASRTGGRLPPELSAEISILELRQVGATGLQVVFSDGHERGIYPWSYLSAIAKAVHEGIWQCAG